MSTRDCEDEISSFLEKAGADFEMTAEYRLLSEKRKQQEDLCRNQLSNSDFSAVETYIQSITEMNEQKVEFFYKYGHRDCLNLLMALHILE